MSFYDLVKGKYQEDINLIDAWNDESKILEKMIPEIEKSIAFNYRLDEPIGIGGSGIVAKVYDKNMDAIRAIKISRPSTGKEKLLADILTSETNLLSKLSHQNLIKIFAKGNTIVGEHCTPFYIMDYIEGAKDSDKYIIEENVAENDILNIYYNIINVVDYLHHNDAIHMDIKPGNIIITPKCEPILADFGFAKVLSVDTDLTLIGGTEGYIHPNARQFMSEAHTNPNRFRGKAAHNVLKKEWDLFSLGKTFLKLLKLLEEKKPKLLSNYNKRYLKLLSCRLLDGYNTDDEKALGLTINSLKEIKYNSITECKVDFEKLIGNYDIEKQIPELSLYLQDTIQVTVLATTPFTTRIREVTSHPFVMRLGSITQLGLLNLIYPTATHTRFEHSLGTFSVLSRIIMALYEDPLNPLFKQLMTEKDIKAVLLAALLHDIGQYPLAHDLEEADINTFSHKNVVLRILGDNKTSLAKLIEKEDGWATQIEDVKSILDANPIEKIGSLKDRILHSLISGPIDADKIDYLLRDSRHLGLKYGDGIDLERLLRCFTIVFKEEDKKTYAALGIHEKGKIPAEGLSFARYAMFGTVYWHHAYRAVKAMLHQIVWCMLKNNEETLHKLKDEFIDFIQPHDPAEEQGELFEKNEDQIEASQIQKTDLKVLKWITDKAGKTGVELFSLLLTRNLYKRIYVLARDKTQDKQLWNDYYDFYKAKRKSWKKKLELNEEFQKMIRVCVENTNIDNTTTLYDPSLRNDFLNDSLVLPLVIIDFPPDWRHSDYPPDYIAEEQRRYIKKDQFETGSLGQSEVWSVLRQNIAQSIGKLRVFCHPKYSNFITFTLKHDDIQIQLKNAINKIEQD